MKVFAGAGEISGDRMLAALLKGLRRHFPEMEIRGFGGAHCAAQGLNSLSPFDKLAVNGLGDVLRKAFFLARAYFAFRQALRDFNPDLVLLCDYPGMNVGLARMAMALGIPVHYVAPPQLWAYRHPEKRLRRLRPSLREASLQVLFPFEREHYAPWARRLGVGHFFEIPAASQAGRGNLLLCPGSRRGVMRRNLPAWLERLKRAGVKTGITVLVPSTLVGEAKELAGNFFSLQVVSDPEQAFRAGGRAIAFPGTMTLELFLHRIPTRICAILDPLTFWAGRRILRHGPIALPNLLLNKTVFPEWVGTARDFKSRAPEWPEADENWPEIREEDFTALREKIGPARGAELGVQACLDLLKKL